MRFMCKITIPTEAGNEAVRSGKLASSIGGIMSDLKPEAMYLTAPDGVRGCDMVVDITSAANIPRIGEPFF